LVTVARDGAGGVKEDKFFRINVLGKVASSRRLNVGYNVDNFMKISTGAWIASTIKKEKNNGDGSILTQSR